MRAAVLLSLTPIAIGIMAAADAQAQTEVRVVTWNLQSVGTPGSVEYDAAHQILDRLGADVVAINEVNGSADVTNFESLASAAGYAHTLVPDSNPFGGLRNAFMSRLPFDGTAVHTSATLSGDGTANDLTRLIVEVRVDPGGGARQLTLVTEHWKSGTTNEDEFRRACESYRVAQTVSTLDPTFDAYVFLGDINEELDSVPRTPNPFLEAPTGLPSSFSLGADLATLLAGPGLVNDPFHHLAATPTPDAAPIAAFQLDGSDATRRASGRRLDYVLVSASLFGGALGAEVYDSVDEGLPGGRPKVGVAPPPSASDDASDHLPVLVDLIVPAASSCSSAAECDDGIFCNGAELCNAGTCQSGGDPCPGATCDEAGEQCQVEACDNDGVCEAGENCTNCGNDCGSEAGATCGNGVCEAADGEDCVSCPADCNGKQNGNPRRQFCCGDGDGSSPVTCGDGRCTADSRTCTDAPAPASCCGDLTCAGSESSESCAIDCGAPPSCGDGTCDAGEDSCSCASDCGAPSADETGLACGNGVDDDCDGSLDCADSDCSAEPSCASACNGDGVCDPGEDCVSCASDCAGRSNGRPRDRFCCGDGVTDNAEAGASLCDGNN